MKQSVSDLIAQIEALLLADVPPQQNTNDPFAAYDPLNRISQGTVHGAAPSHFSQMLDQLKPEQQGLMLTDAFKGGPSPVDYTSIGELYWQPSWANWW